MERAGKLISKLELPSGAISPQDLATAAWPEAVGKRIAAHTCVLSLVSGRLIVEVEDIVWQRQLSTLRSQIIRRLEEVLGPQLVRDVEFRIPVRRRMPQRVEAPRPVADEAENIEDPVLRTLYKQQRRRRSA
jgi:predicted nucleic acid-binding Zn ribbon protein